MDVRRRAALVTIAIFLGFPLAAVAHPEGHGLTVGEVTSVTGDTFELKTAKATFTVKITADTKFERDNKPAEKASLKKGDRIGVERVKSVSGEVVAKRIVLGLPAAASDR